MIYKEAPSIKTCRFLYSRVCFVPGFQEKLDRKAADKIYNQFVDGIIGLWMQKEEKHIGLCTR